jgi:chromosome segregation ATPase
MKHFTTQKLLKSNLEKITEEGFEISPSKVDKPKSKTYESDSEETPFIFSFSSFAPSEFSKPKESRKIQFGVNLLASYQKKLLFYAFNLIKDSDSLSSLNFHTNSFKSRDFNEISLIPAQTEKWMLSGIIKLLKLIEKKSCINKIFCFKLLSDDLSLQRQAFIQNTDRCIVLSEQLFEAKEAREKSEFEKEELAAVLESKTDELNKLLDVLEEYKTWQSKLNSMEKVLNDEIQHWKTQANKFQIELDKKNKEIIEVYSDKKKAEEECLKAYRSLDIAQRQNIEIQSLDKSQCELCESFKTEINTYNELIEEFKKSEEKYLNQIKEMQDQLSRPVSVISQKSKAKPVKKLPKKTLEFEKQPMSENENQFAIEIINLNKQLNKLKHESKTQSELLKKCQHERDELKKLMIGKDESLSRLRKENDQLSLSLSTDHYKSVSKLEYTTNTLDQKNKDLINDLNSSHKTIEDLKKSLEIAYKENEDLRSKNHELIASEKPIDDNKKLMESLNSLQNQFYRLKEMSDTQIQTIESLKQDNYQLMQNIESYKSFARSSKLHADKATGDAEAYANLIKKMEAEIAQITYAKETAESEVNTLKQHLIKFLNTR